MLGGLFKTLFGISGNEEEIDYNYYIDFVTKHITKDELKSLQNFERIKKKKFINDTPVYFVIALPRTQQNNGNISLMIQITSEGKRKGFHGIFKVEGGSLVNYGIREYENIGKVGNYDDFIALEERGFRGHGISKNK